MEDSPILESDFDLEKEGIGFLSHIPESQRLRCQKPKFKALTKVDILDFKIGKLSYADKTDERLNMTMTVREQKDKHKS